MNTILIVDDDVENLETISKMLRRDGYHTLKARSTHDALEAVEAGTPDLFVINVLLPGIDGLGLCRRLRADARTARTPIVMLNSPDSPYGVADALNAGGDDYLRKPFALRELSARIRAHLRRTCRHAAEGMPSLRIFPDTMAVYVNDRRVELTQVEFDLLMFLCGAPNQLHSTQSLLSDVWQYPNGAGDTALVRNHIRNLRRKIEEDPDHPSIIQSRHGRGYAVRAAVKIEHNAVGNAR